MRPEERPLGAASRRLVLGGPDKGVFSIKEEVEGRLRWAESG